MNYNTLSERFRKGSVLVQQERHSDPDSMDTGCGNVPEQTILRPDALLAEGEAGSHRGDGDSRSMMGEVSAVATEMPDRRARRIQKKLDKKQVKGTQRPGVVEVLHCDIIRPVFWQDRPNILSD